LDGLNISGNARMAPGGGNVLVTKSLMLQSTGSLDLADDAAVVDYTTNSPLATIGSQISSGYSGGSWAGHGIRSSVAAAVPGMALGFAESSAILGPIGGAFAGQVVDGSAMLIRYTVWADANVDGNVNTLDFTALAKNFNKSSAIFGQGDFNYDGRVNALDFNILATKFGMS